MARASILLRLNSAGRWRGLSGSKIRTAAGARTARAISSIIAAMSGTKHGVANRLGTARPDGGRRGRPSRGQARDRLSGTHAGRRWFLERAALHGYGLPARVLPALPRLPEILPAVGARALPQPQECQF